MPVEVTSSVGGTRALEQRVGRDRRAESHRFDVR